MYCKYYQAKTVKEKTWFIVGALRNEENLVFERTIDTKESILEFFVAKESEQSFLKIMHYFQKRGYILDIKKLPNRFINE